ncbi:Hypothetical protein LUCI_3206 [Lucifera butyrica]|uniref:FHA domain-containing protein n=1 Tax=Lucifera butyrica TaxID=1351585 RepID=A0A498R985_9FIRM|nr:Hypothetical protein LUCI_3206 [Lucifera butyrica]
MKLFRNVENFFEKHIEDFFSKKFKSGLQPVEIGKQLGREMENQKTVGVSQIFVPNQYTVQISSADYERIKPYEQAIKQELAQFLTQYAGQKEYTFLGAIEIVLAEDAALSTGIFRTTSAFTEPPDLGEKGESTANQPEQFSDTLIFKKGNLVNTSQSTSLAGALVVIDGMDAGMRTDLGSNRVNIGRRESNELPLSDMNTSRLQSYIVFEDGEHVLYDAKSLNGTYVNGHRIVRRRLQPGDRIKVGNTTILYEVK